MDAWRCRSNLTEYDLMTTSGTKSPSTEKCKRYLLLFDYTFTYLTLINQIHNTQTEPQGQEHPPVDMFNHCLIYVVDVGLLGYDAVCTSTLKTDVVCASKCRYPLSNPHGVITHKTSIDISAAVRTSALSVMMIISKSEKVVTS
jgi:hypothetical protein